MRHPEQVANVLLVAQLLADLDKAGDDHEALLHLQADIFRASFRAQLAAGDIARTQKRLDIGKAPGWSENHTAEEREMVGGWPCRPHHASQRSGGSSLKSHQGASDSYALSAMPSRGVSTCTTDEPFSR